MKRNNSATLLVYFCLSKPALSTHLSICAHLAAFLSLQRVSSSVEEGSLKPLTLLISSTCNSPPTGIVINHVTMMGCSLATQCSTPQWHENIIIIIAHPIVFLLDIRCCEALLEILWVCVCARVDTALHLQQPVQHNSKRWFRGDEMPRASLLAATLRYLYDCPATDFILSLI